MSEDIPKCPECGGIGYKGPYKTSDITRPICPKCRGYGLTAEDDVRAIPKPKDFGGRGPAREALAVSEPERDPFEAWCKSEMLTTRKCEEPGYAGQYDAPYTDGAWNGWQASAAHSRAELESLNQTFELRWKADRRATERWQKAHPEKERMWPDHADMVVWLLDQAEELAAALRSMTPKEGCYCELLALPPCAMCKAREALKNFEECVKGAGAEAPAPDSPEKS